MYIVPRYALSYLFCVLLIRQIVSSYYNYFTSFVVERSVFTEATRCRLGIIVVWTMRVKLLVLALEERPRFQETVASKKLILRMSLISQ